MSPSYHDALLSAKVPRTVADALDAYATRWRMTRSEAIRALLARALAAENRDPGAER